MQKRIIVCYHEIAETPILYKIYIVTGLYNFFVYRYTTYLSRSQISITKFGNFYYETSNIIIENHFRPTLNFFNISKIIQDCMETYQIIVAVLSMRNYPFLWKYYVQNMKRSKLKQISQSNLKYDN